jgi:cobalt transporter subunit CbtB
MTAQVSTQATTQATTRIKSRTSVLAQNLGALTFGILILYVVGFAPLQAAHNAAHDVRHSMAFPCH